MQNYKTQLTTNIVYVSGKSGLVTLCNNAGVILHKYGIMSLSAITQLCNMHNAKLVVV